MTKTIGSALAAALVTVGLLACGGDDDEGGDSFDLEECTGDVRSADSSISAEDRHACNMAEVLAESDLAECIIEADGDPDKSRACRDDEP